MFRLEQQYSLMAERQARMDAVVESIETSLEQLEPAVTALTAALNRSRGALWMIGIGGTIIGAIVGSLTSLLSVFHR